MAYVSLQDIRDEGIIDPPYTDEWVEKRIATAQGIIEQLTHCFYEERTMTFELDGTGHDLLVLPVPPISTGAITSIIIADSETALEADEYKVIMPEFPDGRYYPKVLKVAGIWPKGTANITIAGQFGFVEKDGTPFFLAKELCKRLTVWGLPKLSDNDGQKSHRIVEESVKDYSYRLSEGAASGRFGDPQIDNLLSDLYRAQIVTA